MSAFPPDVDAWLQPKPALVLWLTGAGISAESGVPTFRGADGYWRVGSRNYQPQQMATRAAFTAMPDEVWAWYLYRRGVCRRATPNAAHDALVRHEQVLGNRFLLVTQNVDGLHLRAGNTGSRTYQIHGNVDYMRCHAVCGAAPVKVPAEVDLDWEKGRRLGDLERAALRCAGCGGRTRPHVLWFDETYDELNFRFESSLRAAHDAALVIVVGTTGATNLPLQIGVLAARRGTPLLVVNPEPNPFCELLAHTGKGAFLEGKASRWVPGLVAALA